MPESRQNDESTPSPPAPLVLRIAEILGGIVLFCLGLALTQAPVARGGPGLEHGWMTGLNLAHIHSLVFGRDIAFTYGPLGYLIFPEFPPADMRTFGIYALAHGVATGILYILIWRRIGGIYGFLCTLAIAINAIYGYLLLLQATELIAILIAFLALLRLPRFPTRELLALAFITGLGSLTKFTAFGVGIGLIGTIALVSLHFAGVTRATLLRAAGLLAAVPLFSFLLYSLVTRSPQDFPMYLRAGFELSSGYSESMTLAGPILPFGLAWLSIIGVLALPFLTGETRRLLPAWLPAAVICFYALRYGVTRQDAHIDPLWTRLAMSALMFAVLAKVATSRRLLLASALACTAVSCLFFKNSNPYFPYPLYGYYRGPQEAAQAIVFPEVVQRQTDEQVQWMVEKLRLPPAIRAYIDTHGGKGSIEVVPHETSMLVREKLPWRPRPVFQSYSVYTPFLDQWNARFLEERGADFIVLHGGSIDSRFQFWEDPATTRAMLNRYRPVLLDSGFLLLTRESQPQLAAPRVIRQGNLAWREHLTLPQPSPQSLLVLEVQSDLSLFGKLYSQLVRTPPVALFAKLDEQRSPSGRVIFRNLRHGIILNSLPTDILRYLEWEQGGPTPEPIRELWLEPGVPTAFQQSMPYRLLEYPLNYSTSPPEKVPNPN